MKNLVDRGVYQYDTLEEAIKDAQDAANDKGKSVPRKGPRYILIDGDGYYYGPLNKARRESLGYQDLTLAALVEPKDE